MSHASSAVAGREHCLLPSSSRPRDAPVASAAAVEAKCTEKLRWSMAVSVAVLRKEKEEAAGESGCRKREI
jgi:hypothetical protein